MWRMRSSGAPGSRSMARARRRSGSLPMASLPAADRSAARYARAMTPVLDEGSPSFGLRVCVDVPELEAGIRFYRAAFGLRTGRRLESAWVELLGGPCPIDLIAQAPGT